MQVINLTQGKQALVDDADFEWLSQWKWHLGSDGYARRTVWTKGQKEKCLYMHRLVNHTPDGLFTDHVNGDRLDNRRSNLRTANKVQNNVNRPKQKNNKSGFKGVWWSGYHCLWEASIRVSGKKVYLGRKKTPEEAHRLYAQAAKKYYKEFANV